MSKYKSEWKEFHLNKDFWKEVFVGRTLVTIVTHGPSTVKHVKTGDGGSRDYQHHLELDSGEKVWVHDSAEWPDYADIVGKKIESLYWDFRGVRGIVFEGGAQLQFNLDAGNFCIED